MIVLVRIRCLLVCTQPLACPALSKVQGGIEMSRFLGNCIFPVGKVFKTQYVLCARGINKFFNSQHPDLWNTGTNASL